MRFILLSWLLCIASMAYGQEKPNPPKKPAAKEQRGSDANPISVKVLPSQDAKDQSSKQEQDDQKRDEYWARRIDGEHRIGTATWWLVWMTLGLVGVTSGLWFATYRLYRDSKFSLLIAQQNANATTEAAIHAGKSALANTQAVDIMQGTAKRQLRAYVFVDAAEMNGFGIGDTPKATIKFKNFGQTPAYETRIALGVCGVNNIAELEELAKRNYGATKIIGPINLGPGADISPSCFFGSHLTTKMFDDLTGGRIKLYVHGRVDYVDVFGNPHWTTFRTTQGEKGTPVGSRGLAICQEGNGSDRD